MRSSTEKIFDQLKAELIGQNEIAELAGVALVTVRKWRQRHEFPAPVSRLAIGPVWLRSDVEAWLEETGRS